MIEIWAMFILGATAGLHCLGMCGPIVLTLQTPLMKERRWTGNVVYNLGRITTYVAVGTLLFVLVSRAAQLFPIANAKKALTLVVGIFLCLFGLWQMLPFRMQPVATSFRLPGISRIRSSSLTAGKLLPVYFLGIIFGIIPCGMTYAMYVRVLDSPHAAAAAAMCLAFGLGTLPWLLLGGVFSNYLVGGLRKWGELGSGLIMLGLGIERIYRAVIAFTPCPYH